MKQLHDIQLKILDGLLFSDKAKYSDLKPIHMENSQFVFHLDKLINLDLVEKLGTQYSLTQSGKEYANRITSETMKIEERTKVTTVICAIRGTADQKEYLLYKRLKNPFYGCVGFPTEKPKWGERFENAAKRGLKEEASLVGVPELFAIRHYIVYSKDGKLLEDKHMHAYFFKNPKGKLEGNIEGDFFWIKESQIKNKVQKPLEEFWEFYKALNSYEGEVSFDEKKVKTNKF